MPKAAVEDRIPITSSAALEDYFQDIQHALEEPETEHSWQRIDKALAKLEAITKGGGYKFDGYIGWMKLIAPSVARSVSLHRDLPSHAPDLTS